MDLSPLPDPLPDSIPATAALLTPEGRGAVATIRIRGDLRNRGARLFSGFRAANGRPLFDHDSGRAVFGRWGDAVPEDVVVCRIDEQTVDMHCHGGYAAPRRILNDLAAAGAAVVPAAQMQEFCGGRLQQELRAVVSRTRTLRTADIALEQASGLLERALRDLLADVRSPLHQPPGASPRFSPERKPGASARRLIDALLQYADFGRHLTEPWRVVLTGRPNVGKSSLINALVGFSRSIVFDQPGTTRDVVTAETAFDGWPVELIDTAGIRESSDSLESSGIERARSVLQSADCRILLLDLGQPLTVEDHELLRSVPDPLVIAHKCDLPPAWAPAAVAADHGVTFLCVSSKTGAGVEELQQQIVNRLVPEVPPPGTSIPVSPRQIESLKTAREAVLRHDAITASQILADLLN